MVIINDNSARGLAKQPNDTGQCRSHFSGIEIAPVSSLLPTRQLVSAHLPICPFAKLHSTGQQIERKAPIVEKIRFPKMVILVINLMHSPIPNTFSMEPFLDIYSTIGPVISSDCQLLVQLIEMINLQGGQLRQRTLKANCFDSTVKYGY